MYKPDAKPDNLSTCVTLKIAVNPDKPELIELYKYHIRKHNNSIIVDPFPNSGFDLFVPETTEIQKDMKMVSMDVKCEMLDENANTCAFYMYPRSSISKTPLMLANQVGIIDSGYRGFLMGAFRNLNSPTPYEIEKHTRLLQICHPSLCPIYVIMVDEASLSTTSRGDGGFGSTGK